MSYEPVRTASPALSSSQGIPTRTPRVSQLDGQRQYLLSRFPDVKLLLVIIASALTSLLLHVQLTSGWANDYRPCVGCGGRQTCTVIGIAVQDTVLRHRFASLSDIVVDQLDVNIRGFVNQSTIRAAEAYQHNLDQLALHPRRSCSQGNVFKSDGTSSLHNEHGRMYIPYAVDVPLPDVPIRVVAPPAGSVSLQHDGFDPNVQEALAKQAATYDAWIRLDETRKQQSTVASVATTNKDKGKNAQQRSKVRNNPTVMGPQQEPQDMLPAHWGKFNATVVHDVLLSSDGWVLNCDQCRAVPTSACFHFPPLLTLDCSSHADFSRTRYIKTAVSLAAPQNTIPSPGGISLLKSNFALSSVPAWVGILGVRLLEANPSLKLHLGIRTPVMESWVSLLGVDPSRVIWGETVKVQTLIVPQSLDNCALPAPASLQLSRKMIRDGLRSTHFNKCLKDSKTGYTMDNLVILLSEQDGNWDRANQLAVESALRNSLPATYSFFTYSDLDPPSHAVTLGLFSRAVAIVGPHGYMFSHSLSSQDGTCIVEFLPKSPLRNVPHKADQVLPGISTKYMYTSLASGMHYHALAAEPVRDTSNFKVDPQNVVSAVFACLRPSEPH